MEPIYLQTEDALYFYLKKFLKTKPLAVQLDGSTTSKPSAKVVAVFTYSVNGKKYKLFGDTTRDALARFVQLTEEHGSSAVVLKEYRPNGKCEGVILADSKEPGGWRCAPYTNKASQKLKKTA